MVPRYMRTDLLAWGFRYRGFDSKERQYLFASVDGPGDVKFILLQEHWRMGSACTWFCMELSWTWWLEEEDRIHICSKKQWAKIMKDFVLPSLLYMAAYT